MITDEALDFYDMLTQECLVLDRVESRITPDRYSIFHRVAEGLKGHELEAAFLVIVEQIPKFTNAPSSGIDMTREL